MKQRARKRANYRQASKKKKKKEQFLIDNTCEAISGIFWPKNNRYERTYFGAGSDFGVTILC